MPMLRADQLLSRFGFCSRREASAWLHAERLSAAGVIIDRPEKRIDPVTVLVDGKLVLPMQDCTATYGGAIRPLTVTTLTTTAFEADAGEAIKAPRSFGAYRAGLHTLSAAGPVTLLDAKRRHISAVTLWLDLKRKLAKARRG